MHFQLSDDQQMLKSLVERFVQDHYADGQRNTYLATPYGFSPENWRLLGELGIIATAFDEADGGFETDIKTLTVIFEALGRGITT
ncbi:MAG: acyl-CoA dehydrogenase family protein [Pseudomonadota bacterium]|nr:acyl-CoA dehydrogenase family protein [Pseudomonadota bacterium]